MYLYTERILIQILAFSLGPLLGLLATAFLNPLSGVIVGLTAFLVIFLQPILSRQCLKNTAEGLGLEDIVLAEGKVTYIGKNGELVGKLFLSKEKLVFSSNNKVDFSIRVDKISKFQEEREKKEQESLLELTPILERKSPNLPQVTIMMTDLAGISCGLLRLTVEQSIFSNEFAFGVTNPPLWIKTINELSKPTPLL